MKPISILILTYNRADDLLALLQSLAEQHHIANLVEETVILNNASTTSYKDVTAFIDSNPQMSTKMIMHDENLGVARGRNFLIKNAKAPYLLVLDDDVTFDSAYAIEMISKLWDKKQYLDNNTAIITLNIFYEETKKRQETALPHKKYSIYKDKDWFLTYYFTGAAHVMRKELFEETGYYPENFFYGMEEYDLSYRVINVGYTLAFDSDVKVWHSESPSGRQANYRKLQMQWINKTSVAWKYLPLRYFLSTAIMWNFQFLKFAYKHPIVYIQSWFKVTSIPFKEKRNPIGRKAIKYLKNVEARLWY